MIGAPRPHPEVLPLTRDDVVQPLVDGDVARGGVDPQRDPEVQGQGAELAAAPKSILGGRLTSTMMSWGVPNRG